ncbi:50S ribosomal protein L18 [Candidatus Woesearchaeota archaeon]|nr:MAG: 50S ribosomal protein L18 [Candidatus Woesearchaeota archaeon]
MKNVYSKRRTVPLRRKREGKTDYKLRLGLLKSGVPRLVIRKSNAHTSAQIIAYEPQGDKVLVSAHSRELKKLGYTQSTSNTPAAYLVGALIAKRAQEKGVTEAVADFGLQVLPKGGKLYAVLKGAIDAGLQVPVDEEVLPAQERISGEHIAHEKAQDTRSEFEKVKGTLL